MEEQSFVDLIYMSTQAIDALYTSTLSSIPQRKIMMNTHIQRCPPPIPKGLVEIKESIIHGKGVFAKQSIPANQVIGIYPCHAIYQKQNGQIICSDLLKQIPHLNTSNITNGQYHFNLDNNISIIGCPQMANDLFFGHMINDFISDPTFFENIQSDNIDSVNKAICNYLLRHPQETNCIYVLGPNIVYIKTIKDITEGQELFIAYGPQYWCRYHPSMNTQTLMEQFITNYVNTQIPSSSMRTTIVQSLHQLATHYAPNPTNKEYTQSLVQSITDNPEALAHLINMNNNAAKVTIENK
jgi:hypothetical protein